MKRLHAPNLLVLAAASALAFASVACHHPENTAAAATFTVDKETVKLGEGAPRPVGFTTEAAVLGAPLPPPPITGRVATVETLTAPSFAPLSGRVSEVKVRLGDHVKAGDPLVAVKAADLSTMQHDLAAAQLGIKTKQAIVDRTKQMVDARAASQNDLMVAESELAEAKLAATNADAKIQSLSVKEQSDTVYWIIAQRAGTVVQLDATPGLEVGPDKEKPVVTVADLDNVLVVGDLRQREAAGIVPGLEAQVTSPGTTKGGLTGEVETVSEVVDPDRQTIPVRIRLTNTNHAFRPNAYVNVSFSTTQSGDKVVEIPSAAVVSDGAESVVFIETEPGTFKRQAVQLGRQTKEKTEIVAGVKEGQKVVVQGALLLLNSLDVESSP
ncbi:MAG: efflux RND transporter periplasmic adaptor subunit [Polyangiaceae bacterium]